LPRAYTGKASLAPRWCNGATPDSRTNPMRRHYSKQLLEAVARESMSVAGVLRKLGLAEAGGTHAYVSRKLREYHVDTSHFLGGRANSGAAHKGPETTPANCILVFRSQGPRQKAH